MSFVNSLRYRAMVDVVGKAALRLERNRFEKKLATPGWWKHEHMGPPLGTSGHLKELIATHYLKGNYVSGVHKVAWVTSGAPVEFLTALGYFLIYPENHAAMCGIRRMAPEIAGHAEDAGWSREICSYARTDFGAMLSGKTPVKKLPPPDLLVCCTNICQTVLYWYQVLAQHFDVPLIVIDTPFVYDRATPHAIDFVKRQVEEAIAVAERVAERTLDPAELEAVTVRSRDAVDLWSEVLKRGRHRPSPITAFDEFIHMAPIVEMRGQAFTVDYYAALVKDLDARIERGQGAINDEKHRVLWDNLPIWYRVKWLAEILASRGVAMVASTYTNAWGELRDLIDPKDPLESAAQTHIHAILNRGTGHKLQTIKTMVEQYSADGVILHSDRSCKPYSIGQMDQRDRLARDLGVPSLLLEADHNDSRVFADDPAKNRVEAFLELLEDE